MSAVAHGWQMPGGKGPPKSVAQEFHSADKKVGKWEHPVKKEKGGHVKCSTPQPW